MLETKQDKLQAITNNFCWKLFFTKNTAAFLAFQIIFAALTMPFLVFYGPFENIKKTLVGTSWATLNHRYIAGFFLSDEAIDRILGNSGYYSANEMTLNETQDESLVKIDTQYSRKVDFFNVNGGVAGKMAVIYDPKSIAVGYSKSIPQNGETTSSIARRNNAAAAINAGGFIDAEYSGTGGMPDGFILNKGSVIFSNLANDDEKVDTVAFDFQGRLIVGKHSLNELKQMGIREGVNFGPTLIINGKPTIPEGSDGGWGIAPRTAIGQKATGEVIFLTLDGRNIKTLGATLRDIQEILLAHGAVNASNLDGGSSTTMFYGGKVMNVPCDALGERSVSSVFMVVPEDKAE